MLVHKFKLDSSSRKAIDAGGSQSRILQFNETENLCKAGDSLGLDGMPRASFPGTVPLPRGHFKKLQLNLLANLEDAENASNKDVAGLTDVASAALDCDKAANSDVEGALELTFLLKQILDQVLDRVVEPDETRDSNAFAVLKRFMRDRVAKSCLLYTSPSPRDS